MQFPLHDRFEAESRHRFRYRPPIRVKRVQQGILAARNIREHSELGVARRNRVGGTRKSAIQTLEGLLGGAVAAVHEMTLWTFLAGVRRIGPVHAHAVLLRLRTNPVLQVQQTRQPQQAAVFDLQRVRIGDQVAQMVEVSTVREVDGLGCADDHVA